MEQAEIAYLEMVIWKVNELNFLNQEGQINRRQI